jgi:glyoxylase-like metal-dependent hydrolase (beta-lactamase superfamily II)
VIHAIAVPTPFAVGRVNCYLVEDDPLTLVDAGPRSDTSLAALQEGLAEHGRRVEDLERIVLTHQHIDHVGLARTVVERSGAEVCALRALAPFLAHFDREIDASDAFGEAIMLRHGVPSDIALALHAVTRQFHAWGASVDVTRPLDDGDVLGFAGRAWRVHHRPGHSPSDTVFHDKASGELIGGDHLIGHISSNPLLSRPLPGGGDGDGDGGDGERPKALIAYIDSLRATRAMDLEVVLPGHGDPVTGHAALIDERLGLHERRMHKIAGMLGDGPKTGFEIAQQMWGNVAVTHAYLTLSEVLGHIDLLLARGEVVEVEHDGVARFALAA